MGTPWETKHLLSVTLIHKLSSHAENVEQAGDARTAEHTETVGDVDRFTSKQKMR